MIWDMFGFQSWLILDSVVSNIWRYFKKLSIESTTAVILNCFGLQPRWLVPKLRFTIPTNANTACDIVTWVFPGLALMPHIFLWCHWLLVLLMFCVMDLYNGFILDQNSPCRSFRKGIKLHQFFFSMEPRRKDESLTFRVTECKDCV